MKSSVPHTRPVLATLPKNNTINTGGAALHTRYSSPAPPTKMFDDHHHHHHHHHHGGRGGRGHHHHHHHHHHCGSPAASDGAAVVVVVGSPAQGGFPPTQTLDLALSHHQLKRIARAEHRFEHRIAKAEERLERSLTRQREEDDRNVEMMGAALQHLDLASSGHQMDRAARLQERFDRKLAKAEHRRDKKLARAGVSPVREAMAAPSASAWGPSSWFSRPGPVPRQPPIVVYAQPTPPALHLPVNRALAIAATDPAHREERVEPLPPYSER
ncbi:hypothetical protein DFJ73DRAFT_808679 [Zopfochytrium polystomum]|nr:hypothetical protein DFJ73DRAFT_808679 [Zopfochytrium polystomum]